MNKVHFVSLYGVDLDLDLLPHWAAWYRKYDFDRYFLYLQSNRQLSECERQEYRQLFAGYGFESVWIPDAFQFGRIRLKYVQSYHDSLPHGDYLVCADSDEIHGVPADYKDRIKQHEIITGHTVDRYSETLTPAQPDISIWEQYPRCGDVKATVYERYPKAIYQPTKRRILAARSNVQLNYAGSHYVTGGPYATHGDYPVYHFAYRHNCLDRMGRKAYYTADNLFKMARFFGLKWHEAIDAKIAETQNLQKEKGWVPA